MSSVIYRLAHACYHARLRVVAAWLALVALLGVLAFTVGGPFDDAFDIPGASSQVALDQLKMTFPEAALSSASVLVIVPEGTTMDSPAVRQAVDEGVAEIEKLDWVSYVQSPYNDYVKGSITEDRTAGLMSVRANEGITTSTMTDPMRELLAERAHLLEQALPGSEVHVGGELFSVSLPRISVVELLGVGVAIIVLVIVLGSLRAALMPIVAAAVGAVASLLLIRTAAGLTLVNSTTMILALMLALAVGIDYSLFIVSRHRDQLARGMDAEESAARATATAGSAVVFAGLTVIVALVGLAVAGLPFLTIMGVFAAVAVALEVALALTLLPAMLGFAGDKLRPKASVGFETRRRRRSSADVVGRSSANVEEGRSANVEGRRSDVEGRRASANVEEGRSSADVGAGGPSAWWVGVVTKAPIVTVLLVVVGLAALSVPAKDLALALPNAGRNPPESPSRVTFDLVSERFGVGFNGPLVVTGTIVESTDPMAIVDGIRADVEAMPGVKLVALAVPNANADTALVQIIPTTGPDDPATTDLVHRLRDKAPEWKDRYGIETSVTGFTAAAIDVSTRLGESLLPFGIFVVGLSLVLLTMVFRSIWVPVKAALGYLLSVGAAFGIVNLVFNRGIGKEIINLPEAIPVISFLPIILMGILFGLAMDYEVFLTSRMREEWVHGNRTNATEEGFVHSAKVVVAAALIMFAVFAFFVPASEGSIKPIAFGLALGVAIDAFLVRMTLGPAVMKLLKGRAWWLPRQLDEKMPVMDVEGEALAHQLALEAWPTPDATQVVYAEGLGAEVDGDVLFEGVDLDVAPGQTLLVSGDLRARSALLLALTGRLRLTSGEMRVLGLALPEEAGRLRRRSTFVDGASPDAARSIAAARELLVVHQADRLDADARAALVALSDGRTSARPVSVVLGAPDADSVRDLLPHHPTAVDIPEPTLVGGAL